MRIGIDHIATVGGGGNSTYTKGLAKGLLEIDQKNDYYFYVYIHDFLRGRFNPPQHPNVHWRPAYLSSLGLPIPNSWIENLNALFLKAWVRYDRLNVFHFTNPLNFISVAAQKIVTLHDLSSFHDGEWTKSGSTQKLQELIPLILKSSRIISVSEYTKQDAIQFLHADPSRLTTVYEAADAQVYYPDHDPAYLQEHFNLSSYVLYVGQLQPRKNIILLLEAYANLPEELKEKYPLVLAGLARDAAYEKLIQDTLVRKNIKNYVQLLGYATDTQLRKLYSGARAFVYPSLFEGFGLPVLESIQCGTPVITSRTTSLPEVAGEAAILVDPQHPIEITTAIEKLVTDDSVWGNLKDKTLVQASKFSWRKAAEETLAVYKNNLSL